MSGSGTVFIQLPSPGQVHWSLLEKIIVFSLQVLCLPPSNNKIFVSFLLLSFNRRGNGSKLCCDSISPQSKGYDQGYKNEVLVGMQGEGILFTVGGNVINVATLGLNQEAPWYMKIELQCYPVEQFLESQWKKSKKTCWRDACIPTLTMAVFTLVKIWSQLRCLAMNE